MYSQHLVLNTSDHIFSYGLMLNHNNKQDAAT